MLAGHEYCRDGQRGENLDRLAKAEPPGRELPCPDPRSARVEASKIALARPLSRWRSLKARMRMTCPVLGGVVARRR